MASLLQTVSGSSYRDMVAKVARSAADLNGTVQDAGETMPRMTNAHALALFQALRRALARSKIELSESGWELAWLALGWVQPGDKFIMTKEHAKSAYPSNMLGPLWGFAYTAADQLDAAHAKLAPLYLPVQYSDYEQAARDSWETMKRLYPNGVPSPVPRPPGTQPPPDVEVPNPGIEPPVPRLPDASGVGFLLLLLLLAFAGGRNSRR